MKSMAIRRSDVYTSLLRIVLVRGSSWGWRICCGSHGDIFVIRRCEFFDNTLHEYIPCFDYECNSHDRMTAQVHKTTRTMQQQIGMMSEEIRYDVSIDLD